jgi:hypothetical protein
MVPPSAVEDLPCEGLDAINSVGTIGHVTEARGSDQETRVSEIILASLTIGQSHSPARLLIEPFSRDAFLL